MVSKPAVIGIDLGADRSFVAYVGKNIVDIVQNEVSKRDNASLVGFTARERLLGDGALAQIKSNARNTCRNFKHLLGQTLDAPPIEKERWWSTCDLVDIGGKVGYGVTYKGEPADFTPEEVTAMFLTKLREVTEKWTQSKVADVVIGVPSYYSDVHREALLDSARIAGLNVLRLMNEYCATALAYGIYRSNDFDPEKPCTTAFCSMGHSLFSVSIVQFVRGKLTVLFEAQDKVGGRDMDECLMREFAAQFQKKTGCDALSSKKAAFKLEDAVAKTKKVLSSNAEAPVNVECLMEDTDFFSLISRDDFERMCQPMMDKVQAVLEKAKAGAGVPVETIDFVEMVGGSSRVPWVKRMCSEAFGGKEISTTMNADEAVSRGCALMAAILSPHFKVRDFTVQDTIAHEISIGWMGSAADAEAKEEDDGSTKVVAKEGEYKTMTVFAIGSAMNTTKLLTFYRKGPFEIKAQYADGNNLLPGTPLDLGNYKIELPVSADAKKVKVRAKLTIHGTFIIEGAQVIEEEEYEDTVKEKRELPADPTEEKQAEAAPPADEAAAPVEGTEKTEGEGEVGSPETEKKTDKPPEKKYEWVEVKKMKKRTKKTELLVTVTGKPGLSAQDLQKKMDAETAMQSEMKEIIDTDEKRNDLESYIFNTRDKISSGGAWGAYITDTDRDKFNVELQKAEDWLYDQNDDVTKAMYIDKLTELRVYGDPVQWRCNEDNDRPAWISAVEGTIANYRAAAEQPGDKYGHIAPEKLATVIQKCDELRSWLTAMRAQQERVPKTEKPVLLNADMEKKQTEMVKCADEILKEPKPAPPKEEKKEAETKAADEKPAEEPKTGEAADVD